MKKNILTIFLLCFTTIVFAQKGVVSGHVTNEKGDPLQGVSVKLKQTNIGTLTNGSGNFTLDISRSENQKPELVFDYTGYFQQTVSINGSSKILVTLKQSENSLNDVVVVGYGTVQRKDLTGAVASVSGKEIAATPVANVAQAMQGKLPGVNVVSQDGRPGADVSIVVRGGGSISQSNQPLILIDGVPGTLSDIPADQIKSIDVLKDASSTAIYGSRGANGVVLITTKGARSGKTTISYNSYIKYNTPANELKALNPYDYLQYVWANAAANGAAYEAPFEQLYGLGDSTRLNPGGIESYRNMLATNPVKQVFNNSTSWNHDLTIAGGTDKTKVLFSLNYLDDQGMKLNSYAKRINVSFDINQKVFDNVTLGLNVRYTNDQDMDDEGTTSGSGSILSSAYQFRPIATNHILGDLNALNLGDIEQYGQNVLWDQYSPASRTGDYFPLNLSQKLRGIATLDWKVIKGLTYHSTLNLNQSWGQQKYWSGAIYNNYIDPTTGDATFAGALKYGKSDGWGLQWTNTLNYNFSLNKIHRFDILAGQEVTNSGGTGLSILADHFPSNFTEADAFAQINQYDQTAGTSTMSSSVSTPDRITSYFGRVNYTLLDKYLFTATFRADGSSKFSPDHRWGYFPAGAVAWKLNQEPFMQHVNWLNELKIRASLGEVGNDGISANLWSQQWGSVTDQRQKYDLNGQPQSAYGLASSALANPNLKWETTITRDAGTDFSLFNNRLSGTVDVYWNTTKNLLMLTSNPAISGFTSTYANIGQTSNKGIELSLTGTIFENTDWRITAGGNINFNKNNVDNLAPNVTGLYSTAWAGTSASFPSNDYILEPGHSVGLVRGLTYEGVYTPDDFNYNSNNGMYTLKSGVADIGSWMSVVHGLSSTDRPKGQIAYPGLPKYKDLNGDGVIDDKDVSVIGNMNPKNTGGFNLSATFKSIDFGAYFNWSYGNQIYNANKLSNLYGPKEQGVYQNKLDFMNNSYKIYDIESGQLVRLTTPDQLNAANKNATLPLSYNEVVGASSLGIEDGSYLRLNTLVLGYTLPKTLTSKAGISHLRVYGSIYNVLTITGYSGVDPEVNTDPSHNHAIYPTQGFDYGTYPRARSFVFGVNVSF
ncbi:SusC/RagA family TonB-linked outer membrane protein [Arachidicoccus soli]|uniref:TonB-dependent receptor n=1 Tax=Arachidicoccus soli TaxID=2341117 RepID=A0A386HPK2_9BACT|nr:TonB-dependent receptor [Arachidicoccus soli]AYD47878.1 TonB-dependent receptor [Arachidicoccus soli]